ncbi:MAG: hypothetical protein IJ617_02985 [Oscillospiraceae bacterium]|nr:hypothetical protein [Oscillospiraceae bacterium]
MPDQLYTQRFGDRKEGRMLRSLSLGEHMAPYFVPRDDAGRCFTDSVELGGIEEWLRARREENLPGLGMLHLLAAAYVRTLALCPGLNRFISGQRLYARYGIEVVMAVKRSQAEREGESTVKVAFSPEDTIYDVYRRIGERVDALRADERRSRWERMAGVLTGLPGPLAKFAVWSVHLLDGFDWLPRGWLEDSPFHGSVMIADLGGPGAPCVARSLNRFGNLPVLISMGGRRRAFVPDASGEVAERQYIDYSVVFDGRIADPLYCAGAFRHLKRYLGNPALLELPPERVAEDVF